MAEDIRGDNGLYTKYLTFYGNNMQPIEYGDKLSLNLLKEVPDS